MPRQRPIQRIAPLCFRREYPRGWRAPTREELALTALARGAVRVLCGWKKTAPNGPWGASFAAARRIYWALWTGEDRGLLWRREDGKILGGIDFDGRVWGE